MEIIHVLHVLGTWAVNPAVDKNTEIANVERCHMTSIALFRCSLQHGYLHIPSKALQYLCIYRYIAHIELKEVSANLQFQKAKVRDILYNPTSTTNSGANSTAKKTRHWLFSSIHVVVVIT